MVEAHNAYSLNSKFRSLIFVKINFDPLIDLQELGPEVVKVFILPHVAAISRRIDAATEPSSLMAASAIGNIEKIAASHIRNLIVKAVAPIVRSEKQTESKCSFLTPVLGYHPCMRGSIHGGNLSEAIWLP